jgi:hypothetical protein
MRIYYMNFSEPSAMLVSPGAVASAAVPRSQGGLRSRSGVCLTPTCWVGFDSLGHQLEPCHGDEVYSLMRDSALDPARSPSASP